MRVLVVTILIAVVARGAAVADDKPPAKGPGDLEAAALVHLDRGIVAFEAGEFARAHRELLAAHELVPDKANPYRWLALTEIQLGDCASALGRIDGFVARVPADDARVAEMTRWRDLCRRTGVLSVESRPSGAALRIDGSLVGTTPYRSLSMRAGKHDLVAELPGRVRGSRSVELPAEGQLAVVLDLPSGRTPITRRWWFWPAVGVVALGVAGAIVFASSASSASILPPITCDDAGCRP